MNTCCWCWLGVFSYRLTVANQFCTFIRFSYFHINLPPVSREWTNSGQKLNLLSALVYAQISAKLTTFPSASALFCVECQLASVNMLMLLNKHQFIVLAPAIQLKYAGFYQTLSVTLASNLNCAKLFYSTCAPQFCEQCGAETMTNSLLPRFAGLIIPDTVGVVG